MAKITLIALQLVVLVGLCSAEAPLFRKVIRFQRQELPVEDASVSAPYPAAGFTPETPFQLPIDAQVVYPAQEYGAPTLREVQVPVQEYGPPTNNEDEIIEQEIIEGDIRQPERLVVYRTRPARLLALRFRD